ncbi:DUF748 domain-containing protein [Aliiglaciecola aliphaticivorans]
MTPRNISLAFRKQPGWLRYTTYLLSAYFIYALILGLLTPLILQSQLPKILSDKLQRDVTIEKISINPFLLRIRVANFVIEENKRDERFVNVSQLEVDASFWQTLINFTPTLESLSIKQPYLHLARLAEKEHTEFNFSDILDTLQAEDGQQEAATEEAGIAHFRVNYFTLEGGQILLSDEVSSTNIALPNLAFELTEFDTQGAISKVIQQQDPVTDDNHYDVHIETAEGGSIDFTGQMQLAPFEIKGNIALSDIALAPLWPLSNDLIEAKLTDGLLGFYADYHLSEEQSGMRFRADNTQLSLSNLAISASNEPRIKVAAIDIKQLSLDTDSEQINLAEVTIDQPWIDANFDKQGLDLQGLFTPTKAATSTQVPSPTGPQVNSPKSQADESKWRVILQSFALNKGTIELKESMVSDGMYWQVLDLNLATGVIDTAFETPIEYKLALALGGDVSAQPILASGHFSSDGEVSVATEQVTGSFKIEEFALTQLQSYLLPYVNATIDDGLASVSGTFDGGTSNAISIAGEANIANLSVIDGLHQQPLVNWQDMNIQGIQYQSAGNQLSVKTVRFDKPFSKFIIYQDKQTNIGNILVQNSSSNPDSTLDLEDGSPSSPSASLASAQQQSVENAQAATSPMVIIIDDISINDGRAYFEDNSLKAPFASGIEQLNGNIASLSSSPQSAAKVDLVGKIDGYAPVLLKGEVNPLIEQMFLDLNFTVDGAELTSVNPYSGTYMGHFIDKGLLSINVNYLLENNQLVGDNQIVIDQLTLGRKTQSEQAVSLPLSLAIALLQDSNGVIDLGMEVSGDLNNPSFGFGSIIFKALGNIITKAVTAPFSLLANLVGSEDELNKVAFADGVAELDETASQTLSTLAAALAKRPGLRVDIEGTVDEVTDAYELAEQKLLEQLLQLSGETSLPDDFGPSTVPLSGPLTDALTRLFTSTTNKLVEQEREVVKGILQEGDSEKVIPEQQLEQALLIAMYNQVRSSIDISRRELANLAAERAKAVKLFLTTQGNIDPNRLFLLNSRQHLASDESGVSLTLEAN